MRDDALWMKGQATLDGFPANRLVRLRQSKVPRDWVTRWSEALALGVLPDAGANPEHAAMMEPRDRSLNHGLEARPRVSAAGVRRALGERLAGLARWDGDTLVFTDPNGTREYDQQVLASVWGAELPARFHGLAGKGQMQKEAFLEWKADHERFADSAGEDKQEDLRRAIGRILPSGRESGPMYRGLEWNTNEAFSRVVARMRRTGMCAPRGGFPFESWAGTQQGAGMYTRKRYRMMLSMRAGHPAARDVSALTRHFAEDIAKIPRASDKKFYAADDEIMVPTGSGMRVKSIRIEETESGKTAWVELEPNR